MSRQQYGLSSSGVITEAVRKFLVQFRENVSRGNAKLLYSSYTSFKSITEKTYQVSTWPLDTDVIRDLRLNISEESTRIFLYLYRELFYRHAFNRCDISFETMHDSFTNYMRLFNTLLKFYDSNKKFCEIPNVWLWDMINSFVSQFQYYHHWRSDSKENYKNMNELLNYESETQQKSIQQKWNVQVVLRYLHYFVHAAKIPIRYNEPQQIDPEHDEEQKRKGSGNMMQMLGFFSLIGLCRIHTILADYRTAIDVMAVVDLKAKSAITQFASCCVSAHYYLSFAYCMTRRFPDAHSMLCTLLRNPRYAEKGGKRSKPRFLLTDSDEKDKKSSKSEAVDQELSDKDRYHGEYLSIEAMLDRSWAMLAIANTQCPTKLDEVLLAPLRDYFGNDMDDINDNSSSVERRKQSYAKLFQSCAPDFINVFSPFRQETGQLSRLRASELCLNQFGAFMRLTNKRHDMLKLKNEICLFCVIPFNKLVTAMNYEANETGKLNRELVRLKWRLKQNKKIDAWGNTKDQFTFYIKDDCVYIQELQTSQLWKYSDYFIRNTQTVTDWLENYPSHL